MYLTDCLHVRVCSPRVQDTRWPGEGVRCPGSRITGNCDDSHRCGTRVQILGAASVHNCWAISVALKWHIWNGKKVKAEPSGEALSDIMYSTSSVPFSFLLLPLEQRFPAFLTLRTLNSVPWRCEGVWHLEDAILGIFPRWWDGEKICLFDCPLFVLPDWLVLEPRYNKKWFGPLSPKKSVEFGNGFVIQRPTFLLVKPHLFF